MFKSLVFLAVVGAVWGGKSPNGEKYLASVDSRLINPSVAEDANLDVVGLATKYGYPVEAHTVQTEDGYLLTVHRINAKAEPKNKPVAFLMHGILCSSAAWVMMGPDSGLGYYLADEGFDVWMGNARGNYYSRQHVSLNPDKDSEYWKFSWNEIGFYDLPATIDYILEKTGEKKLHYVGHSQGTTSFFVMASLRKEYNDKIKSMHALAPAVYMSNLKSPLFRLLAPLVNAGEPLISLIGADELKPSTELMRLAEELLCRDNSAFQPVCSNFLFLLVGYSPELLNTTMLPVIFGHTPAGAASRQLVHYTQEFMSAKFRKYDHGLLGNLATYGSTSPPNYNLGDVSTPVALHYSDNDWFVAAKDADQVYRELGNPIGKFLSPKFNHLDFLWAINIRSLLYNRIIDTMKLYNL